MNNSAVDDSSTEGDYPYKTAAEAARSVLDKLESMEDQCTPTKHTETLFLYVTSLLQSQAEGRITTGAPAIADGLLKIREIAGEDHDYGLGSLDIALSIVGHYGLGVAGHDLAPELGKGHANRVQR